MGVLGAAQLPPFQKIHGDTVLRLVDVWDPMVSNVLDTEHVVEDLFLECACATKVGSEKTVNFR